MDASLYTLQGAMVGILVTSIIIEIVLITKTLKK